MRVVADLHVHSKYARATSKNSDVDGLSDAAKIKGIDVIATGDFTHPLYFKELKEKFRKQGLERFKEEEERGLFNYNGIDFILSVEISVIYTDRNKTKKMHHVVLSPNFEVAEQIMDRLKRFGDLKEDGRPTLHMSSREFAEELFGVSEEIFIIPAHVWTPWFSIFGSRSGVDSVEEAFGEYADRIFALETGLSSDPKMNMMVSKLEKYTLVSNSDAHSPGKIGREANVFDVQLKDGEKLTYRKIIDIIKSRKGFVKTYEFYPQEGKYFYDGHRKCGIRLSPEEAEEYGGICPVCKKRLTIGVLHRVEELADRKQDEIPKDRLNFQYIVPLKTLLSVVMKKGESTKAVEEEYDKIVRYFGNELSVFEADASELRMATDERIVDAIVKVKEGKVKWLPGYDGVFGEMILNGEKRNKGKNEKLSRNQKNLGEFI